jgi:O-antigen/teichoic acid export membrane protein
LREKAVNQELSKKTAKNIGYTGVATLLVSMIQFLTSIVLARVLVPDDYGIVGFAQIFINFMMQFSDFGINGAMVQKKELDDETIRTAFSLKVFFSILMLAILLTAAPMTEFFIHRHEVVMVVRLLSLNFLFSVVGFLPQALLTRDLKFHKLIVPQTISVVTSSLFSILMANLGFSYWSIVLGSLLTSLLSAIILAFMRPSLVRLGYNREIARQLLRFGGSMFFPGVIVFVIFNTDNFIIGSIKGVEQLGYYAIAFNWGSMVCTLLTGSIHKVLFPTFCRLQDDLETLKKSYLMSLRYVAFLAIPANLILMLMGKEFLFFVLGRGTDRWLPALLTFQILCGYGILRAVTEPIGNVVLGIGRPQLCLKAIIIVATIQLSLLYPAVKFFGIEGVAGAVTISYLSQYFVYLPIMKKEIGVKGTELYAEIKTTLAAVMIMVVVILIIKSFSVFSMSSMIIQIATGLLVYVSVFGAMDRWKLFSEIRTLVHAHQ